MKVTKDEQITREELIKSARKIYKGGWWQSEQLDAILEELYPELKESEDERIRKKCIELIKRVCPSGDSTSDESKEILDCIAYLEKQKEQTEELSIRLNGLMQEYVKSGKDEEEQEHRLKCYQLFWDALGDSEFFKQKEQPAQPELKVKPIIENGETVGVVIPVINKALLFREARGDMDWDDAIAYAKRMGKALPTLKEGYILQFYRDDIAEFWPEFSDMALWSSSQYSSGAAWGLDASGLCYYGRKYYGLTAVPLSDLNRL